MSTLTSTSTSSLGSYGAGLTRHLLAEGVRVVEVDRPNRQRRRRRGKSDPQDAITAARAAQSGDAKGQAKTRDGNVEAMRVLRVARNSARSARTQCLNQMRSLISTAPEAIRAELLGRLGLGVETTSALLVAAGDNPERLRNGATFAHLCGASPLDASSGKQERHRLNRGGDRQANSALWKIAITRMVYDPHTREYIARRVKEGLTKKEAIRCLKRYIAREVYNHLPRQQLALDNP